MQVAPKNTFGIADHTILLPDGSTISSPLRYIENGKGSELIFTLFWLLVRREKEFLEDAKLVEKDLGKGTNGGRLIGFSR